jgi:hypothetical protein
MMLLPSFSDALAGLAREGTVTSSALASGFGDTYWYYYYSRLAQSPKS